jgi:hypothetical protein
MHNIHQTTVFVIGSALVRVLARPVFHFAYHKLTHNLIHASGHKIGFVGRIFKFCKWAPDCIMIGALTVLDLFSEGRSEHNEHETNEATKE